MNIVLVLLLGQLAYAISNNPVYIRKPNDRGPTTWDSGLKCIQNVGNYYLTVKIDQSRTDTSLNMVITHSSNMSTPAAQIQDRFLNNKHESVNVKRSELAGYLTSIVSDAVPLLKQKFNSDYISYTDAYVLIVDSVERLQRLFEGYISKMQNWNPGARFFILYNNVDDRNRGLDVANEVFGLLLNQFYVNTVSLLYSISNTAYDYYILDNFNEDACRKVKSAKLGTCDDGDVPDKWMMRKQVYQLMLKTSLRHCTFYMCAAISAPFIEDDCVNGFEMHLIQVIQNKLGFDLNITCGDYNRGIRIPENDTWTDLLGRLDDRLCDFILGGYYSDDEVREDFWVTDSYLSNSHAWFIATAAPRPPWKALFAIFQANMWAAIVVVLLITWFFWLTFGWILPEMKPHKSPVLTAINSWGVTIGASVSERPQCQASRIFFIGLCLYSMNVTSVYTSKLIAVFANPGYEHQISTIEEVIRQRIPFGGPAENRDWFENPDDMDIYMRYNDSDNFVPRTRNLRAVLMGERVILANRMYMLRNQQVDQMYGFPDNVFSSAVEIIAKRGFPFLNRFNVIIRMMKDHGLFSKIDRDFRYHYTVLVKIKEQRVDYQESVIVLTIHHLEGAFAFLIFGILLSMLAFAGEQIHYRYCYSWLCKEYNWYSLSKGKTTVNKNEKKDEKRLPIINVRMEQIRFTPVKRRKIRLNRM